MNKDDLRESIPYEFYRAEAEKPYAESVEQLIEQLERLPPDLPVRHGFDLGCRLVVYNLDDVDEAHLEIIDAEDFDE